MEEDELKCDNSLGDVLAAKLLWKGTNMGAMDSLLLLLQPRLRLLSGLLPLLLVLSSSPPLCGAGNNDLHNAEDGSFMAFPAAASTSAATATAVDAAPHRLQEMQLRSADASAAADPVRQAAAAVPVPPPPPPPPPETALPSFTYCTINKLFCIPKNYSK